MPFSSDTENVLNYLERTSPQGLRRRDDMGVLLEIAAETDAHAQVNDLAFHGTHLYGLYRALDREAASREGQLLLEREFADGATRLREILSQLLAHGSGVARADFDSAYFEMTVESLRNLVDLAHDFGVLKGVQNAMKRG